jgi:hypothetical protein
MQQSSRRRNVAACTPFACAVIFTGGVLDTASSVFVNSRYGTFSFLKFSFLIVPFS